jgi:nucleoside-diphosphate-sugar epimerase
MKILLTGITGFLGSHLAEALTRQGHEVIGLKRLHSKIERLKEISDRVRLVSIENGLEPIFEAHPDIRLIIHAATAYGNAGENVSNIVTANVVMPLKLLEWSVRQENCAFINSDTFFCKANETYGHLAAYIATKKFFLQLAKSLATEKNATFCNMQIEHMYGPGDGAQKFTTSIVQQLLDNKPEIKLTPGQQVRDFVFVDDVVEAYLKVAAAIESNALKGLNSFEVGTGMPHTVIDFVTMAHRITASKSQLLFGSLPYRESEIMHSQANVDALNELGWRPKIKLENGIEALVKSMRSQS